MAGRGGLMSLIQWFKKIVTPNPDVYYVPEPCQLTRDIATELKKKADRRRAEDKRRLMDTFEPLNAIHEDIESRIHADSADPARSIRE